MEEKNIYKIKDLISDLWEKKYLISASAFIFGLIAALYVLTLPNIYQSSMLLKISENESSNNSLLNQYGGLAAIAGFQLDQPADNKQLVVAQIASKDFLNHLLGFEKIKQNIFASNGWDRDLNQIKYDEKIYDDENNVWVREPKNGLLSEPDHIETFKKYNDMLQVSLSRDTGFISVSIEHHSPFFAKEFLDLILGEVNNVLKQKDILQTELAIDYLIKQLDESRNLEVEKAIGMIMEAQIKKNMLANISEYYILEPIDSAYLPVKKIKPFRSLICLIAAFLGAALATLYVLVRKQ